MSDTGRSLFLMYHKAGTTVLAHRLQHLFHPIQNKDDIALHNDILAEVILILDGKEREFMSGLTDLILHKRVSKQKRFFRRVAQLILDIGHLKGQ